LRSRWRAAARDGANNRDRRENPRSRHPKAQGHHLHRRRRGPAPAGGKALPILCDIREEAQVMGGNDNKTVAEFGRPSTSGVNTPAPSALNRFANDRP